MMDSKASQELNAQVQRSVRYRTILESEPWEYLLSRAADQVDKAVAELKTVSPQDANEIIRLQNIIRRNEDIGRWLREVMDYGDLSRELIEAEGLIE